MKLLLSALIILALLIIDGTLAYDPFDLGSYSLGDLLGLLLVLFMFGWIAEHTKKNKNDHIQT